MVAEWSKAQPKFQVENTLGLRFQSPLGINIDCSEVEILFRYSNCRAPGDMCRLRYMYIEKRVVFLRLFIDFQ